MPPGRVCAIVVAPVVPVDVVCVAYPAEPPRMPRFVELMLVAPPAPHWMPRRLVKVSLASTIWASMEICFSLPRETSSLRRCSSAFLILSAGMTTITLPCVLVPSCWMSRIVSRAWSQGTSLSFIVTLPLTSSPATMLRPLTSAMRRKTLRTLASWKSAVIFWPV